MPRDQGWCIQPFLVPRLAIIFLPLQPAVGSQWTAWEVHTWWEILMGFRFKIPFNPASSAVPMLLLLNSRLTAVHLRFPLTSEEPHGSITLAVTLPPA